MPPITKQVVMNAASTMCGSRSGNDGLKTMCHQFGRLEHAVDDA